MGLSGFAKTLVKLGVIQDKRAPRQAAPKKDSPDDDSWWMDDPPANSNPAKPRSDPVQSSHSKTHILDVAGFLPRFKTQEQKQEELEFSLLHSFSEQDSRHADNPIPPPAKRLKLSTKTTARETPVLVDKSKEPPLGVGVTGREYATTLLLTMLNVLPGDAEEIGLCLDRGAPKRKSRTHLKRDKERKAEPITLGEEDYFGLSGLYLGSGGTRRQPRRADPASVTSTRALRPSILSCLTRIVEANLACWPSPESCFCKFPNLKRVWLDGVFLVVKASKDPLDDTVTIDTCDETRNFVAPDYLLKKEPEDRPSSGPDAESPDKKRGKKANSTWSKFVQPHLLSGEGENACVEAAVKRCPNGAQIHSIDLDVVFVLALSLANADFKARREFRVQNRKAKPAQSASKSQTGTVVKQEESSLRERGSADLEKNKEGDEEEEEDDDFEVEERKQVIDLTTQRPTPNSLSSSSQAVLPTRERYCPQNIVALLARERYMFDPVVATDNLRKNGLTWAALSVWISLEKTDYCDPNDLTAGFGPANRRLLAEMWVQQIASLHFPDLLLDYQSKLGYLDASTIDVLAMLDDDEGAQCLLDLVGIMKARKTKKQRQAMTVDIYRASIFKNMAPTSDELQGIDNSRYQVRYFYLGIDGMLD